MVYRYFSLNAKLFPVEEAVISLDNIDYAYGFGVYETIRVTKGKVYFLDEHAERLFKSAHTINLQHTLSMDEVRSSVRELIEANQAETCNIKLMLIGGATAEAATLYGLCLNPAFPDRQWYREGVDCITYEYEREWPQAKTLNMLPSYMAYRAARKAGAYDALLINKRGEITEGTRTNFLAVKGRTVISPPIEQILPGVTRHHVMAVAKEAGFEISEQAIPLNSLAEFDAVCLTSTSSKILPIKSVNEQNWPTIAPELRELMTSYDQFLATLI